MYVKFAFPRTVRRKVLTYLLTYSLFDFSGKRVPKLMQLKRVSSAFRRLAWRKALYLLTYLSTFPENVKNAFRPPARRVSKTFVRILRGFWPLHPYLLLEVTKISGVVWVTFRRVVRRKADFRCFFCFFDAQIDRYVRKYWIFDRILRGISPLTSILTFRSHVLKTRFLEKCVRLSPAWRGEIRI